MSTEAAINVLLLGGLLGLFGQGARVVVGLKTLTDFANAPSANQTDVFNAARLTVSLIIGFLAGIAEALAFLEGGDPTKIGQIGLQQLLGFAGAGYIGTDIIEAFIAKYFDSASKTGLKPLALAYGDF